MFLTVAFLAAGKGTRYSSTGEFDVPKVMVPVEGVPMIIRSYRNLMGNKLLRVAGKEDIFNPVIAITKELNEEFPELQAQVKDSAPTLTPQFYLQDGYVAGPARTAEPLQFMVPSDSPLLLSNVDQVIDGDILSPIHDALENDWDGVIFCFDSDEDRYSYVTVDENNFATSMVEKEVVSNFAGSGIAFFKKAETLFSYIDSAVSSRGMGEETYISDVCNEAIKDGAKFKVIMLDAFIDLGTPKDLENLGEKWKTLK